MSMEERHEGSDDEGEDGSDEEVRSRLHYLLSDGTDDINGVVVLQDYDGDDDDSEEDEGDSALSSGAGPGSKKVKKPVQSASLSRLVKLVGGLGERD